jgi:hypothetical protein
MTEVQVGHSNMAEVQMRHFSERNSVGLSNMAEIQEGHLVMAEILLDTLLYDGISRLDTLKWRRSRVRQSDILEAQAELPICKGPNGTLQNREGPGRRVTRIGTEVESSNAVQVQVGHFNMAEDQLGCFMAEN